MHYSTFYNLIEALAEDTKELELYEKGNMSFKIAAWLALSQRARWKRLARIENLEELVSAARQFDNGR